MKSTSKQGHDALKQLELFKRFGCPPLVDVEDQWDVDDRCDQVDEFEDPPKKHQASQPLH